MIEAAGLKGTRVGNVEISTIHANYLVNLGGGSSEDALELTRIAREKVRESRHRARARGTGYRGAVAR